MEFVEHERAAVRIIQANLRSTGLDERAVVHQGAVEAVLRAHPAVRDAAVAADYVASWAGFYQDQIARPWPEVVRDVRQDVQAVIDQEGAFVVSGDLAAFVCR